MSQDSQSDYTRPEVALVYANCAERLYADNPQLFTDNPPAVPVLVHLLYQSLKISLKHIGRHFNLWPEFPIKGSLDRSHDIQALANSIDDGFSKIHIRALLQAAVINPNFVTELIFRMLCESEFEETRNLYKSRNLAYAQLKTLPIFSSHTAEWIQSVKEMAQNLDTFINSCEYLRENRMSDSVS